MPNGLPAWPSDQLLSNSVVQIAVNSAGQVVSARLLGRSGLPGADNMALDKSRNLRFKPVPASPPAWGRAVFAWETAEATNTGAPGAP
jgi:TonB family protein